MLCEVLERLVAIVLGDHESKGWYVLVPKQ